MSKDNRLKSAAKKSTTRASSLKSSSRTKPLSKISLTPSKNGVIHRTSLEEGIDVSHHNNIDWGSLDTSIHFALIKATDGTGADPNYVVNINAARQTGLHKIGSYHFFRPDDSAAAQFQSIQNTVDVRPNDFPIAIDVEYAEDTQRRLTPGDVPILAELINLVFNQYQAWPMIYTNDSSWKDLGQPMTSGNVNFGLCPLWIADPNNDPPQYPQPWIQWTLWQYGQSVVAGVNGNVDRNRFAGSFEGLKRMRSGAVTFSNPQP